MDWPLKFKGRWVIKVNNDRNAVDKINTLWALQLMFQKMCHYDKHQYNNVSASPQLK